MCEDGRPLQEVWMVLEFCNRGTLSDAIQRGWLLSGARALLGPMAGGLGVRTVTPVKVAFEP